MTPQPPASNTVSSLELDSLVHEALMRGFLRVQVEAQIGVYCEKHSVPAPSSADLDSSYARNVDRWAQRATLDDDALYALHIARREDVYSKSYALNDYKTCAGILKDLAQLEQQYRREKKQKDAKSEADKLRERIKASGRTLNAVK